MIICVGKQPENVRADYVISRLPDKSEITIDQIHELQKQLAFKTSAFSVVILEAQFLNISAQNALLKTLEEPPEGVIITLYVDHEDNLLPTIVSRCIVKKQDTSSKIQINHKLEDLNPEKIKDRNEAIKIIDDLLSTKESLSIYRKLQKAKKYLQANCNLRLTLENLFL